jgi:hypothetical protein
VDDAENRQKIVELEWEVLAEEVRRQETRALERVVADFSARGLSGGSACQGRQAEVRAEHALKQIDGLLDLYERYLTASDLAAEEGWPSRFIRSRSQGLARRAGPGEEERVRRHAALRYEALRLRKALGRPVRSRVPSTQTAEQKVFVSYNKADASFARQLATDLAERGFAPWLDEWEVRPGDFITQRIETGLTESDAFVIVLSPGAVASDWVKVELASAYHKSVSTGKPRIFPVLLENCDIPALLSDVLYVDFRSLSAYDQNLQELAAAILGQPLKRPEAVSEAAAVPPSIEQTGRLVFESDFGSGDVSRVRPFPGTPLDTKRSVEEGTLEFGNSGGQAALLLVGVKAQDIAVRLDAKILEAGADPWVGFKIRSYELGFRYGYLVYLRGNGELNVWCPEEVDIGTRQTGLNPCAAFATLAATARGAAITAQCNELPPIVVHGIDPLGSYAMLHTNQARVRVRNLRVWEL